MWTHVAYVQSGRLVSLYFNGVRDTDQIISGAHVVSNNGVPALRRSGPA